MAQSTCYAAECERPAIRKGLCHKHSERLRRTGSPTGSTRPDVDARFWSKVERTESCWLWRGAITSALYGSFYSDKKRVVGAHRWAYEQIVGPIPEGLELDHLCRVRHCVNPAHLEPVSSAENYRRGTGADRLREKFAAMAHCKRGHTRTPENLYYAAGRRLCRPCRALFDQERRNRGGSDISSPRAREAAPHRGR